ncbi:MAG: STAS domain-containing protein [Nitrospirota bacterium]|nr:STAS domain-containing protein [Nitrospirota bacterium]
MADIREETTNDGKTIIMSGELTVSAVNSIKITLLNALRVAPALQVRLESVSRMDIAFLQLLCSAHRTAADSGKQFTVSGDPDRFLELLKKSGFQRHIGCRESGKYTCLWLVQAETR